MRFEQLRFFQRRPLTGASLLGAAACAGALCTSISSTRATAGALALAEEAPRRGVAAGSRSYMDGAAQRPPRLIIADPGE